MYWVKNGIWRRFNHKDHLRTHIRGCFDKRFDVQCRRTFYRNHEATANVTAVGDTTGGGSAGGNSEPPDAVASFYLPSGKMIDIGTVDLRRYDGLPWEWLGVPPDIRVVQTEADINQGRDKQLEYAIDMLK